MLSNIAVVTYHSFLQQLIHRQHERHHHQHGSSSSFAGMTTSLVLDSLLRGSTNENGFKGSKLLVPEDMASLINAVFPFSLLLNYFPSFFQCEIIEKVNDPVPCKGVSADIFN